jgi:inhibitor of cysteine peptidase
MLFILGLTVLGASVAVGCSSTGKGDSENGGREIAVDYAQSGKQIEAAPGDIIKITLDSNITTGYQWQLLSNSDEQAVSLLDHQYVEPTASGGEPIVGAGGSEEWTFEAAAAGSSELHLEYSQPWEGGMKAEQTFDLTIVVK